MRRLTYCDVEDLQIKQGFTLVELSLSLIFISILSLTIVLMINNAVESYQRGVTLNQINTVGMDLVDDIRTAVQNSSPEEKVDKVAWVRKGAVSGIEGDVPLFGIFCTGAYTYVWNSGYYYSDDFGVSSGIEKISISGVEDIKLVKIRDMDARICEDMENNNKWDSFYGGNINLPGSEGEEDEVAELLGGTDNNLVLYSLDAFGPASGSGTAFYSISFILGTMRGGININAENNICKVPQNGGEFNSCAINKFNFAAQATGGKSE